MRSSCYRRIILKISQTNEGLKDPKHGLSVSPSSSFSPFFKNPGAGVPDSPGSITSAIFMLLLTVMPVATSTGGYLSRE